jgi:hypothetical protein
MRMPIEGQHRDLRHSHATTQMKELASEEGKRKKCQSLGNMAGHVRKSLDQLILVSDGASVLDRLVFDAVLG